MLTRDALTEGAFWSKGAAPAALAWMSTLLDAQQLGALHQQRPSHTEELPVAPPFPVTPAPAPTGKKTRVHKNSRAARLRAANASIAARQDAADALDPTVALRSP